MIRSESPSTRRREREIRTKFRKKGEEFGRYVGRPLKEEEKEKEKEKEEKEKVKSGQG